MIDRLLAAISVMDGKGPTGNLIRLTDGILNAPLARIIFGDKCKNTAEALKFLTTDEGKVLSAKWGSRYNKAVGNPALRRVITGQITKFIGKSSITDDQMLAAAGVLGYEGSLESPEDVVAFVDKGIVPAIGGLLEAAGMVDEPQYSPSAITKCPHCGQTFWHELSPF